MNDSTPTPVVYVIAEMITGGTQTHLLQVLSRLDRERFRPHLFVLRDGGNLLDAAAALDVAVETFSMKGSLRSPSDFAGLSRMIRRLRALRPGIVHAYLLRANFFGAVAARAAAVPVIVTSKRGLHQPSGLAERFAVRVSNALSTTILGNAGAVLEFTRTVEGERNTPMVCVPSGIDVERFDPRAVASGTRTALRAEWGIPELAPIVGAAITFRPRKGFKMLFEAFARLREQVPNAYLVIAGADSMPETPRELAESLGIVDVVRLLGRRSDMPAVYSAIDVFTLPSESEGMSNAILEAMAMRLPVVATEVGGAAEVLAEGETGYLLDYGDVPALTAKLAAALVDDEAGRELRAAARRRVVANYSSAAMVAQFEALYDRLLEGRTGGGGRVSDRVDSAPRSESTD